MAGCGAHTTRPRYDQEFGQDSVRWQAVVRDGNSGEVTDIRQTPYAMTWPTNRVMNLWTESIFLFTDPAGHQSYVAHYGCAFRAALPLAWAVGDTIRGTECAASPDTIPVLSGSLWAVVDADTMHGETVVDVATFLGTKHDTLRFRLERAPNPTMN